MPSEVGGSGRRPTTSGRTATAPPSRCVMLSATSALTNPVTDLLTVGECATLAGIKPATWRAYVTRGQAPQPAQHISRTPLWDRDQVQAWASSRKRKP